MLWSELERDVYIRAELNNCVLCEIFACHLMCWEIKKEVIFGALGGYLVGITAESVEIAIFREFFMRLYL